MNRHQLWKQYLIGAAMILLTWVRPAHSVLIQDNDLILDTNSGLYWAPISFGVVAPQDLPSGFRYATSSEVNGLLTNIPNDPCINIAPSTPCGSQTIQAALDFIEIFETGISDHLRAIYDPILMPDGTGMAMALSLFVNLPNNFITLDTQGVNFPRPPLEEGMLLVMIAVPELSTLLLLGGGALVGLWYSWKRI